VGRKRTVCIYIDAKLVEEAAKAAEERGASLSGLVEDALRLYAAYVLRRPEPQARKGRARSAGRETPTGNARREDFPVNTSLQDAPAPPPPSPAPQLPPHLQNNAWVAVLRSRR